MDKGKIYLIGTGPGDRGLVTLRAQEILKKAEVVIYDYLINPDLLSLAPETSELICLGQKTGRNTLSQAQINQLLIKKAKKGKMVARLKAGDPFIFGRGPEEALALSQQRIPFEIVPGVTSLIAATAYAGIPLTFRKFNSAVTFISAQEEKEISNIPWDKLAGVQALVFLVEVKNLEFMVKKLMENGKESNTKVALIEGGATLKQKTIYGSLKTIVPLAQKENIVGPVIFVVGEVAKLRDKLNWFEKKALLGKTVLITVAPPEDSHLRENLEELGAEVIEFPAITITDPTDYGPLDSQIDNLSLFNWIIFTSVPGVQYFFKRLFYRNKDLRDLKGIFIVVMGPTVKEKLENFHLKADFMPTDFTAQAIINILRHKAISGQRILLPSSPLADESLANGLRQLGAEVREVVAYNTVKPEMDLKLLKNKKIDIIAFSSFSTVNNFMSNFSSTKEFKQLFPKTKIASIGPVTSKAIRRLGLTVHTEAKEHSSDGLMKAMVKLSGKTKIGRR